MQAAKNWIISFVTISLLILTATAGATSNSPAPANLTKGNDSTISQSSTFKDDTTKRHISIALDGMDVKAFMDYVLGEVLGVNYLMDPAIKGTLSLHVAGEFTRQEFINVVNTLLQMHGLALVNGTHGLYKVVRKAAGAQFGGHVMSGSEWSPGDSLHVIRLKYLSAEYAVKNLKPLLSPGAFLSAEPSLNGVLVVDTVENVSKVKRLLGLMDVPVFKDVHWRIFTLEHGDISELSEDLKSIFRENAVYIPPGFDVKGLQFIPLRSINSLLVVTRWEEMLDVVAGWVSELDRGSLDKGSQVHVYFVQNGNAKEIAEILKQIYMGAASVSGKKKNVIVKRTSSGKSNKKEVSKGSVLASGELSSDVEIIPDEVNNALIIKANGRDYAVISQVLKKIDVLPRQVLIDVLILEVTLNDKLEYGVEWFFKNNGISIDGKSYSGDLALSDGTTISMDTKLGEGIQGLSYALFNSAGDLRSLLRALADKTDVNILSAPNILALDNHEAVIEAGDDVPTLSGTTTTTGGTVTQSVEYRNAGIILKVKPYINDSGLVRLEVNQEVSQVFNETTGGINSPRFTTRKANTNLVARDGQTILIGGLMQTTRERTRTGVPLLKDLPVLGYLFGSRTYKTEKKELLIAITPHVIKSQQQADQLTHEFMNKVKSLREMLASEHMLNAKDETAGSKGEDDNATTF